MGLLDFQSIFMGVHLGVQTINICALLGGKKDNHFNVFLQGRKDNHFNVFPQGKDGEKGEVGSRGEKGEKVGAY